MSTNTQIISDALSLIGVLAEGETASAEQAAHGLRKLNQMMSTWEVDSIVLGYFQQSDVTAVCPIPDWSEKGVYGMLAVELAPDYNRQLSPEAAKIVNDGYELILRRVISLGMKGADMTHLGGNSFDWDIEKGW